MGSERVDSSDVKLNGSSEQDTDSAGLEAVFELAPVGCLVLDCEGRIRRANPAAARLLGREAAALIGVALVERAAPECRAGLGLHLASVQATKEPGSFDVALATDDAVAATWLRVQSAVLPPSRYASDGLLCIATPIDDLMAAERGAGLEARGRVDWDPAYGAIPGEGELPGGLAVPPAVATPTQPVEATVEIEIGTLDDATAAAFAPPVGRGGGSVSPEHDLVRVAVRRGPHRAGAGRVLVVDDDAMILSAMVRILCRMGFEAESHRSPIEALACFSEDPGAYGAVVTDYEMPGMTGLQLAEALRALRPGIGIVMITGSEPLLEHDRLEAAGIGEVYAKPIDVPDFLDSLEAMLEEAAAEGATEV